MVMLSKDARSSSGAAYSTVFVMMLALRSCIRSCFPARASELFPNTSPVNTQSRQHFKAISFPYQLHFASTNMGVLQKQTQPTMQSAKIDLFMDLIKHRRSVYDIDDKVPKSANEHIETIVKEALQTSPSPWNISSSCCLVRHTHL